MGGHSREVDFRPICLKVIEVVQMLTLNLKLAEDNLLKPASQPASCSFTTRGFHVSFLKVWWPQCFLQPHWKFLSPYDVVLLERACVLMSGMPMYRRNGMLRGGCREEFAE